jgi:RNA polymerase sigma-70 factor, ECF subfamily
MPVRTNVGPDLSDEELMVRVQQGDSDAYRMLFDRHNERIYAYLVRRVGQPELARDLFQDTFLSIHRAKATWSPSRPFRPWLYGIATNAVRDHFRKTSRRPMEVEVDREPAVVHPHPVGTLDLERAIALLPDPLREAFLLGAVEGFDHNEVAVQLGINPDAARARISRARAQLRLLLDGERPE